MTIAATRKFDSEAPTKRGGSIERLCDRQKSGVMSVAEASAPALLVVQIVSESDDSAAIRDFMESL